MEDFLRGVNFCGIACAARQNGENTSQLSNDYIDDSFKIFKQIGIQCVRIPLYWESHEKNPDAFIQELDHISSVANRYGVSCVYDNHQWKCSSYFGEGIGFPNSLLTPSFGAGPHLENTSGFNFKHMLKRFWNGWWDRRLKTVDGKDCWDAQLEFLEGIVNRTKDKSSTLGFEILNEPMVFRQSDFRKVGIYHDYFVKKISNLTSKTLFFCFTSSDPLSTLNIPWEQAKTKPSHNIVNNIIFDIHPYPPSSVTMGYYKVIRWFMKNVPIYAGEFNAGIKPGVAINRRQFKQLINRLKSFKVVGFAFWQWSYIHDYAHPAFNLINIAGDRIYLNENFKNFADAIK